MVRAAEQNTSEVVVELNIAFAFQRIDTEQNTSPKHLACHHLEWGSKVWQFYDCEAHEHKHRNFAEDAH